MEVNYKQVFINNFIDFLSDYESEQEAIEAAIEFTQQDVANMTGELLYQYISSDKGKKAIKAVQDNSCPSVEVE